MKKSYTLDLNVLTEQDLTIEEFITLLSLYDADVMYDEKQEVLESLQLKDFTQIILEEEELSIIKKKGRLLINSVEIQNNSVNPIRQKIKKQIDPEIDTFVKEFRNLWKGLKPGSMGSQNGCKQKLIRWMKDNPEVSKEEILKASKNYLRSLNDLRYLQQADYFISKRDLYGESSRLSSFIDETSLPEDSWSSNLN